MAYADAKISYYTELRAAMPELTNIAMGREPRPQELNKFRDAFRVAQNRSADPRLGRGKDDRSLECFEPMNRNSSRRAKLELKLRRQAGEKLTNPKSKRRTAWWGGISKRVPVKSL